VTAPVGFTVRAVSMAWSPPINGPLHARLVDVGEGKPEDFRRAGNIEGAVLLVHSDVLKNWDDLFQEYLKAPPIIDAAVKGKAAALAFMATREHDILYRHINAQDGHIDRIPQVLLAREDALRLARLLQAEKKVEVEINMPNKVGGPIETSNVVAELRGSEKPEEWVLLGAHLDSWELGTGALDDGCNAALVIDALRAIKNSGLRPKRSIRFVLFSGEEQGVLGSEAYVRAHRAELDNAVGTIFFDEGTGAITGFSLGGRKDMVSVANDLTAPLRQLGGMESTTDAFIGTDNFDFLLEGVPNLVANQKEANYLENYHATSDTYDKVDFAQLKKHLAIAAALAFEMADRPEHLAPRQSRAQIEPLLHETGLEQQMKTFGLWEQWRSGQRGRAQ
jgi:Zn-dependent M28 family amino/carboxypeptidase